MPAKKGPRGVRSGSSRSKPVNKRTKKARRSEPVLGKADIRRILLELVVTLAPADIAELMAREEEVRGRVAELSPTRFAQFRRQLELALDCLRDHLDGRCPQIPYYTISLLAAAVWYFGDALDIVPDFLPRIGNLDDAAVAAMAFQLGHKGIVRYCDWRGVNPAAFFGTAG